jgi:putative ABC transport system permease protein
VGILISAVPVAYAHYDDLTHFQKFPNVTPTLVLETEAHDPVSQALVADALQTFFDLRNVGVARIVTRAELEQDTFGGFDILISILIGMAIIVAVVGGLGLAGTMSLNVLERTREIGVMRAVGASTNAIRQMFIIEGVLIGFLSAIIALPLSTPASMMFGDVLGTVLANRPLPFTPTLEGPVLWFVIIMFISGAASLMPAQCASQISVREALAYE